MILFFVYVIAWRDYVIAWRDERCLERNPTLLGLVWGSPRRYRQAASSVSTSCD